MQLRCEDKEAEDTVVMATVSIGLPDTRFGVCVCVCEVEKVHRSAAPLGAVSVVTKKKKQEDGATKTWVETPPQPSDDRSARSQATTSWS